MYDTKKRSIDYKDVLTDESSIQCTRLSKEEVGT